MGTHVGALIVEYLIFNCENTAIAIDGSPDLMVLLTRVVSGDEMLAAIFYPLHRPPHSKRSAANQYVLRVEFTPNAETAANVSFVQMDQLCGAPEHAGDLVAVQVRYFGGAMKLKHVAHRIVTGNRTAGFQRDAGMPAD